MVLPAELQPGYSRLNLARPLSSVEVSFVFPVDWGMGRREIKRAGTGEKGNESARGTLGRE